MLPEEKMHPLVRQSIIRYIGYGWGNALIQSLIRYRFNVRVSARCLNTVRSEGSCTAHCLNNCPFDNYIM